MSIILDLLKSCWKPIAGLLAGLLVLFQRWRINRQADTIDHQDRVIRGHEAKEQVHEQDREINATADKKITDIRRVVNHARNQEEAARAVSDGLNEFFRGQQWQRVPRNPGDSE